jgi:hypothetical protein
MTVVWLGRRAVSAGAAATANASATVTPATSRGSSPGTAGPRALRTASVNSAASPNRCIGSRAVARLTSSSTERGTPGWTEDGAGTSFSIWLRTTTKSVAPVCGATPVSIS